MSGKRQHYIPRFIQKGFASHTNSGNVFTWLYRKNATPINTNIINVGVESSFYTNGNDTKADNLITAAEKSLSNLVKKLRTHPLTRIKDHQIPELIVHLEIRTRHLRQNFLQASNYLVSKLLDFICDEDSYADYLLRTCRNDPSILRKALAEEFVKYGLPMNMLETILRISSPMLPSCIEQLKPMFRQLAAYLRSVLPKKLEDAVKSGHIKVLKKDALPEPRIQQYKDLMYEVVEIRESNLILGDSVILFNVDGSRSYKTFLDKNDVMNAVILPLTPNRLLVGACEDFVVSKHNWTETIARCSFEYFIANENSDTNRILQESIAEDAALITRAELEEIITEIMDQ